MFDSIVLRNSSEAGNVTWGALAEAMLFYQNVRLILGHGTLISLARTGELSQLIELVKTGRLHAVHCEETLATIANTHGASKAYGFSAFTMVGHEELRGKSRADRLEIALRVNGVEEQRAKILATDFARVVPAKKFTNNDFVAGGITHAAMADARDRDSLKGLLRAGLAAIPGGYDVGENFEVDYVESDLGFFLFAKVDVDKINRRRAALTPPAEPLTLDHIFNLILESRADLHLAAHYGGDFATTSANSALVRWRQEHLLRRSDINALARADFSELVLPTYPSVRDVIDSGERSFTDFLKLLDKAQKFKAWLAKASPDRELVAQYIEALRSDTWADKAPAKMVRYLMSVGMGNFDPALGFVSGAADALLLDKLFKGWRPNHFVDDRLKPFLGNPA
ncbi:hypothetical protein ACA040_002269 [Xenophilus aerolatus]